MDQFVKDHPFEAAAMRTQKSNPEPRSFEFEELPPTVRHRIYEELLLVPKCNDEESAIRWINEHAELGCRTEGLMVEICEDGAYGIYPEIMSTNKKIHEEAPAVLYGENWFTWCIHSIEEEGPMWQNLGWNSFLYLPRCSRLIAKMRLVVSFEGTEFSWRANPISERHFWITKNLQNVCKVLSLNDLKFLKVEYFNDLGWHCGSSRRGLGEPCLEPLKKLRAERFVINTNTSPRYATEFKTVIEGPKDATFQAYRQAAEEELAIHYIPPELSVFEGIDPS